MKVACDLSLGRPVYQCQHRAEAEPQEAPGHFWRCLTVHRPCFLPRVLVSSILQWQRRASKSIAPKAEQDQRERATPMTEAGGEGIRMRKWLPEQEVFLRPAWPRQRGAEPQGTPVTEEGMRTYDLCQLKTGKWRPPCTKSEGIH